MGPASMARNRLESSCVSGMRASHVRPAPLHLAEQYAVPNTPAPTCGTPAPNHGPSLPRMRNSRPPRGQGEVASRIHALVRQNPGLHFRELGRLAGLRSTGQLRHHLDSLTRRRLVLEIADGRFRRYFPAGQPAEIQPHLARLARPLPRRIVSILLSTPLGRTGLRRQLACADSTLGYHLQRLLHAGDVEQVHDGRGTRYALVDPERIRRILQAQECLEQPPTHAWGSTPAMDIALGLASRTPNRDALALAGDALAPAPGPLAPDSFAAAPPRPNPVAGT